MPAPLTMKTVKTAPKITIPPVIPAHLRRLVLTGFMGAGKSTIGRLLAARLQLA
jgi:shikimate kinase